MAIKTKEIGEGTGIYYIYCSACKCHHSFHTKNENSLGAKWSFDGNLEQPTFNPSLLVRWEFAVDNIPAKICHSYVRNGYIEYQGDCTHSLVGQTVELTDIDETT